MARAGSSSSSSPTSGTTNGKSIPETLSELKDLTVSYAKQETIDPLKGLLRFIGAGVAGSLLLGTGLVLVALAGLRALQTETGDTFDDNFTWAPYLIVLFGTAVIIGLAVSRIGKKGKL
jgi:hypothetical protein